MKIKLEVMKEALNKFIKFHNKYIVKKGQKFTIYSIKLILRERF